MPANAYLLEEILRRLTLLEKGSAVLETRTEERHTENLAAQAQMGDDMHVMRDALTEHIRADERSVEVLTRSLTENTKITTDNAKMMASVHAVVVKIDAAKTVSGWIKGGLAWVAAVFLSIGIIVVTLLWAFGGGPFPVIHP